jgi:hypothetical protein
MFKRTLPEASQRLLSELHNDISQLKFYLGGGNGLAMQLGHRISEDFDFFTTEKFQPDLLSRSLENKYEYQETMISAGTLYCNIEGVKTSFIFYQIPLIYPVVKFGKIEIADWQDIMAEKFKVLSQRGSRKDFHDVYACFNIRNLSIAEGISILKRRFAETNINYYHILKSLVYFEDAENEPQLILLKPVAWQTVKDFFKQNLPEFEKYLLAE